MQLLRDLGGLLQATWAEWGDLYLDRLIYSEQAAARQLLVSLIGIAAIFVVIRSFGSRNPGHHRMALPAIVKGSGWSRASLSRHGALILALAGLPFFALALSDPRTSLTRSETTYPGRRIALLIDASSSMLSALPSTTLAKGAPNNAAFFTTVGAARYFIERRMASIQAIDRRAAGTIEMKQYSTERPRYAVFALTAAGVLVRGIDITVHDSDVSDLSVRRQ